MITEELGIIGLIFEILVLDLFARPWNLVRAALNDELGRRVLLALGSA
ncbi:hypothetical protein [Sulfodiicoccus acidiphilus]|nr:hypothetical protein [Sulfodiicoccus acidiphilus]